MGNELTTGERLRGRQILLQYHSRHCSAFWHFASPRLTVIRRIHVFGSTFDAEPIDDGSGLPDRITSLNKLSDPCLLSTWYRPVSAQYLTATRHSNHQTINKVHSIHIVNMSDPLKYTIGWICPIDKTFVAARAFLEEIHEPPVVVSQRDNNSYVLGRVSGHNVVIASVSGEYGTASAAVVTRDTILSFPNIRFYLMVGIGSGAPSAKHDIRLGDVVVGNRGVFQYDFRETIQNQTFVETGSLDQPPTSLLEALSTLEATYDLYGQQLDDNIKDIIKRHPRLRKTYSRPSASSDRLYKPSVCHTGPGEPCSEVCGDDVSLLELRSERKEDEDNPAIHYGKIGTSNQLIEDALIRDQLTAEREVLCFEIEAAGLMSHLPCLVIRGICDYADSHKNGKWHGYAAMAAAAYAKDLLCPIPPGVIERETSVKEVLADSKCSSLLKHYSTHCP